MRRWAIRLAVEKGLPPLPAVSPAPLPLPPMPVDFAASTDVELAQAAEVSSSAQRAETAADEAREKSHGGYAAALLTFGSYHLQVLA